MPGLAQVSNLLTCAAWEAAQGIDQAQREQGPQGRASGRKRANRRLPRRPFKPGHSTGLSLGCDGHEEHRALAGRVWRPTEPHCCNWGLAVPCTMRRTQVRASLWSAAALTPLYILTPHPALSPSRREGIGPLAYMAPLRHPRRSLGQPRRPGELEGQRSAALALGWYTAAPLGCSVFCVPCSVFRPACSMPHAPFTVGLVEV